MYLLITIPYFKRRPFDSNHVAFVRKFIYFHAWEDMCFYLFVHRLPTFPWRGSSKFVVLNVAVLDLKSSNMVFSNLNDGHLSPSTWCLIKHWLHFVLDEIIDFNLKIHWISLKKLETWKWLGMSRILFYFYEQVLGIGKITQINFYGHFILRIINSSLD